ncbi:MAG: ion transporter [Proteobacteria bacterium]|nr:MAG: ion transporter [Pseudomonadota bacterium]
MAKDEDKIEIPVQAEDAPANRADWRKQLYIIIFGSDTKGGKIFDIALLWSITFSILCVMLESVPSIRTEYRDWLRVAEWCFTALFTLEYVLRIISSPKPSKYATSFFGIIDLVSILPTFISFFVGGYQGLIVIRVIRLLRIFRILKLVEYSGEASVLLRALSASRHKITVFIGGILTMIVILGAMMYLIEGPESGFTSIPISMYWSVVTLTTVGYGDITPLTAVGKIMASVIMLLGYGILAVPTGIVSVEIGRVRQSARYFTECPRCGEMNHLNGSRYCFRCGERLADDPESHALK